jgi:hypothetical protein
MSERERAQLDLIESLMAFERASDGSLEVQKVLPPDCDLDTELNLLFDRFRE